MKQLFSILTFAGILSAQTTGQLCWTPDKTQPTKTVCRDVTPALKQSLTTFIATQQVDTTNKDAAGKAIMAPKYNGIGDLIFTALADSLFTQIIDLFPPANVVTAKAAIDAGNATLVTRKATHIGKTIVIEPIQ